MLSRPRYVIAVHDLERSARYYRDVLGFEVTTVSDPGWCFLVRDECFIMAGNSTISKASTRNLARATRRSSIDGHRIMFALWHPDKVKR